MAQGADQWLLAEAAPAVADLLLLAKAAGAEWLAAGADQLLLVEAAGAGTDQLLLAKAAGTEWLAAGADQLLLAEAAGAGADQLLLAKAAGTRWLAARADQVLLAEDQLLLAKAAGPGWLHPPVERKLFPGEAAGADQLLLQKAADSLLAAGGPPAGADHLSPAAAGAGAGSLASRAAYDLEAGEQQGGPKQWALGPLQGLARKPVWLQVQS